MAEGEEWEIVKIVGTEEEATIVVGFLNSSDIPAEVESLLATELPADVGHLGEVRVRVPAERAAEALEALNSREDVATGEDGALAGAELPESADVPGEGEPVAYEDTPAEDLDRP
ncbi:MAG TPA: hypothetical protein VMW27_23960 [Thermoanaerobaculia bacterium]|nr:hypothetical protein [Thermoanaerobaculia bacterium]